MTNMGSFQMKRLAVLAAIIGVGLVIWLRLSLHMTVREENPHILHAEKTYPPGSSGTLTVHSSGIYPPPPQSVSYSGFQVPNSQHETARRRVETTATELWYFLDAGMTKLRNATSGNTTLLKVVHDLQNELQGYHTAMERDFYSLRHVDRDEEWRLAESRRLGDLVQRRLNFLQNPQDCSKAKLIICDLTQDCGFGCKLHHATSCLLFAYATQRTLVLEDKDMRYHSEHGWQTFFQPLSKNCTKVTGPVVKWNDAISKAIGGGWDGFRNFFGLKKEEAIRRFTESASPDFRAVLDYASAIRLPGLAQVRLHPDFLPLAIPQDLAPRLMAFHGDPAVWWIGQFVRYVIRPNAKLVELMNTTAESLGFKRPVVGVHIRRTDKVDKRTGEAPVFHTLEEYMGHVEAYFRLKHRTNNTTHRVYLATDDPQLLQEARTKYPGYVFISDISFAQHASLKLRYEAGSLRGIIMDILFLSMTDYLVCTFSSNIGRAAYELMQTRHADASQYFRSLDDVYFFHGQNSHNLTAIEQHVARDKTELSFEVGDRLRSRGNYWEAGIGLSSSRNWKGFTDGYSWRTRKTGMFPSYKAVSEIVTVKMPTYPEVMENMAMDDEALI